MKKALSCIFAALLLMSLLCLASFHTQPAVAFDGNDYDYGGGDDWGYDNDYGYDYDDDYDGDYDGDYHYNSDYEPNFGDGVIGFIGFFSVLGIPFFLGFFGSYLNKKKRRAAQASQAGQAGQIRPGSRNGLEIHLPDRTEQIENIIKARDPNFSASDFVSFVKRVYIEIETAWCNRDLVPVRVYLHDNLYDTTARQIQAKIDQHVVYHYESMVVNTAYLTSYAIDRQFEYLTLYLNARMIDWQEDERTGKILRGDKTTRWDLRYKMKFMRSTSVLTKEAPTAETAHNCPNCAAPLNMASSTKCEYCGSVITTGMYRWVLSDFGTIRNDTIDEGIRQ